MPKQKQFQSSGAAKREVAKSECDRESSFIATLPRLSRYFLFTQHSQDQMTTDDVMSLDRTCTDCSIYKWHGDRFICFLITIDNSCSFVVDDVQTFLYNLTAQKIPWQLDTKCITSITNFFAYNLCSAPLGSSQRSGPQTPWLDFRSLFLRGGQGRAG
jgi:hypothetical protein